MAVLSVLVKGYSSLPEKKFMSRTSRSSKGILCQLTMSFLLIKTFRKDTTKYLVINL
jgi:hypothetical protein